MNQKVINEILVKFSLDDEDEMYAAIGCGSLNASQVLSKLVLNYERENSLRNKNNSNTIKVHTSKDGVLVDGTTGLLARYAGCCNPVSGDEIIGYISHGKGVTIHRTDCQNLKYLEQERLISAEWEEKVNRDFIAEIRVFADNEIGILAKITSLMAEMRINMKKISATEKDFDAVCDIVLLVKDKTELERIMKALENVKSVKKVIRKK